MICGDNNQLEHSHCTLIGDLNQAESSATQTDINSYDANLDIIKSSIEIGPSSSDVNTPNDSCNFEFWSLHFDNSKSHEGAGAGCILRDPKGKIFIIDCRIKFECTKNTVKYKALL